MKIRPLLQKDNVHLVMEKIPLFILTIASCVITYFAQKSEGAVSSLQIIPIGKRLLNTPLSYVGYIANTIWPQKLAFFYPYPKYISIEKAFFSGLLLILVTLIVIKFIKKYPWLFVGWFWYAVTLVPVIGLVQVGSQAMADRYAYLSLIGLFIMIAWTVPALLSKWLNKETVISIIAGLILVACIWTARSQVDLWKNSYTLFQHALKVNKNNYLAHNNLGIYFYNNNRLDESIMHYAQALRINSNYAYAHNNLGAALVRKGELKQAKAHLHKAIQLNPDYAEAYNNLGSIYGRQGTVEKAIVCFRKAVQLNPDYKAARNNLKIALSQKQR